MVNIALLGDISFNSDLAEKEPGAWKLFTAEIENYLRQADIIIKLGKLPALPGDSQSLTFPGF